MPKRPSCKGSQGCDEGVGGTRGPEPLKSAPIPGLLRGGRWSEKAAAGQQMCPQQVLTMASVGSLNRSHLPCTRRCPSI